MKHSEVEKQLFRDQAAIKREQTHPWELTGARHDLPIPSFDPDGDGTESSTKRLRISPRLSFFHNTSEDALI
jgi:hypothetical protein